LIGERLFDKTRTFSDSIFANSAEASKTVMLVAFVTRLLLVEGLILGRLSFFLKNPKGGDNMHIFNLAIKNILR
jgi:hypothetical protein